MGKQMTTVESDIARVEDIVAKYSLPALAKEGKGRLTAMIHLAEGMQALREAITPAMLSNVMQLQGTKLGFKTDKDTSGGYRPEAVKEVVIEALLRGAQMVGNEVNIISGGCYLTKEFFERATRELEGVTDIDVKLAVPQNATNGALVSGWVHYKYKGQSQVYARTKVSDDEDLRIAVRVNSGMGVDAILGKARRKLLAGFYEKITGITTVDGDVTDGDGVVNGTAEPARTTADLTRQVAAKKQDSLLPDTISADELDAEFREEVRRKEAET
jgi:hypothetical protein